MNADGVVGMRGDGRFGFTRLELSVEIVAGHGDGVQARALAEEAERTCLVRRRSTSPSPRRSRS